MFGGFVFLLVMVCEEEEPRSSVMVSVHMGLAEQQEQLSKDEPEIPFALAIIVNASL